MGIIGLGGTDMYSCCGIDCEKCECFIAAKEGNVQIQQQAAGRWSDIYRRSIAPGQIRCQGCMAEDGEVSLFCADCAIRKCCRERNVHSCASCDLFPCAKTMNMLKDSYAAEQFMKLFQTGV